MTIADKIKTGKANMSTKYIERDLNEVKVRKVIRNRRLAMIPVVGIIASGFISAAVIAGDENQLSLVKQESDPAKTLYLRVVRAVTAFASLENAALFGGGATK